MFKIFFKTYIPGSFLFLMLMTGSYCVFSQGESDSVKALEISKPLKDPTRPLTYRATTRNTETLQLNSILFARGRKLAVISGQQYGEKQQRGSVRVLSIDEDSVVISQNGKRRTLFLHRTIRSY